MTFETPVDVDAGVEAREERYREVRRRLEATLEDEGDWVAAMATTSSLLDAAFAYYDWTGFYRHVEPEVLVVGPYQGSPGCLRIPFSRGICGAAARTRETQFVEDVSRRDDHIACSASTQSEVVVPVFAAEGSVAAVLDVDSDNLGAFSAVDRAELEATAEWLRAAFDPPGRPA